jgi:type I restriction enzyme S subunit
LNRNFIYPIPIRVPKPCDQQRIAAVLSALDAKIELNHRINAELEGLAKLLYDYWFVQFEFPLTAAQAAALGKPKLAGHPYQSSGGPMVNCPQLKRKIPKGWRAGSLNCLGEIVGGSTPSTQEAHFFSNDGTPWITPKDLSRNTRNKFITRGETDVTEAGIKGASLTLLPAGTVLMSSRAPIGYTAIARNPVTTNQGFKSFVPSKGYPTEFIYYTLNRLMKIIEQNASGSTFKEVSAGTLKTIQTHLPDQATLSAFSALMHPIFSQQDNIELQNQELTALRDWLLPLLMNWQVRVG